MKKKRDDSVSLSLKVTRIMKITLILILVGVIQVSATTYAQEHRISVSVKNGTFYDVVSQIERQSEFMFFYKSEEIDGNQRINLNAKNKLVSEILDEITKNNNLTYKVTGKHIIITKTAITSQITKEIVGVVTDERGEPIVGANVVEKGTSNGTITDLEGKFSLTVSEKSVLIVSYIGYNTQDVTVTSKTVYNIQLEEDSQALDEVVVVGYGTQKKVNLTGSVASVSSDEIKDRVQTDVLSSIQGTVPGVTIVSRPGKDVSINFRGRGNLGTSEPLYVIDGAIADATFFSNLDPNSIESISFLKDAASSAIYGSRAAYGVVLVTTKQGKDGRMEVSYSGMVGMKAPTYTQDLVNSWEYAELYNEALYNTNPSAGKNQGYSDEEINLFRNGTKPDLYPNTNWVDLLFDDWTVTTKHSLNFSGGTKKLRYFAGLGYVYDTENIRNRDTRRYNLNLNVASDVTDWLTFRGSVKYIQRNKDVDGGTPSFDNILIVPSTFVARQSTGEWGSVESGHEASGTDAYWKVDGKTLPEKIQVDARKANYEKIWNYAKNLSEEDYKTFATSPELMSYDYMKEFKNRDSRLYVTLMFPFKGWHETAVGEFYYKWNPDVINKDGNESWTGFSYRKMVAWEPYIASVYGSADDYPTIRYAEVLLTFAEAHLMTTGYDDQVRFALNQLRDRCGMPDVPESLGTQEAIDFLRNERRIELAVEGHRYDDVRRYGNEYCQKYLQGPSTAPNGAVVVDKKWNERLMLMPIPTTAIDVNPLLKEDQNPGY